MVLKIRILRKQMNTFALQKVVTKRSYNQCIYLSTRFVQHVWCNKANTIPIDSADANSEGQTRNKGISFNLWKEVLNNQRFHSHTILAVAPENFDSEYSMRNSW